MPNKPEPLLSVVHVKTRSASSRDRTPLSVPLTSTPPSTPIRPLPKKPRDLAFLIRGHLRPKSNYVGPPFVFPFDLSPWSFNSLCQSFQLVPIR